MKNTRAMSAGDVAKELIRLTTLPQPSSGNLRSLEKALLPFRGYSEILDEGMTRFSESVDRFVTAVQRGHVGRPQWAQITSVAAGLAPTLEVLDTFQKS